MKMVLLYLPVLHRGYLDFLKKYQGQDTECVLIGPAAFTTPDPDMDYLFRKDFAIRGVPVKEMVRLVEGLELFSSVRVFDSSDRGHPNVLICPDEDVTRFICELTYPHTPVVFDDSVRLRYDRKGVERVDPVPEDSQVTQDELHQAFTREAENQARHSRDWWLRVGALAAYEGLPILVAYNKAAPVADMPNILGDPRSLYSRGEGTDDTLVLHAERSLVSQAAATGRQMRGTDVYVTHFPCAPCAASLAEAGIARLFFRNGYSRLESAEILRAEGIELIRVLDDAAPS